MTKINILKAIGTVAVINILARLLGFMRELAIGYQFGTSDVADLIITVYTVPNFLYIVIGGAVTTAFISIYMSVSDDKDRFLGDSLKFIGIVALILTAGAFAVLWIFRGALFSSYMEENEMLLNGLLLWMIPSTFFLIISTWMNGVLNSRQKFGISTFSSLIFNLIFLVAAVALSFVIGPVAYGIGAFAAAIFMVFYLNRYIGLKKILAPVKRLKLTPEIKRMVWLALPIILGGATIQFYFLIHRYFSLQLTDGFVSAVNYASKLTQFPQALLMTIVTTVLYPLIAKGVKQGDRLFVSSVYFRGLRMLGLLLIPTAVFLWLFGPELVEVVYEHGNFTAEATAMTAPLLQIFGLSLFFISANMFMTRFFYAHEISLTPVIISIASVFGVNVLVILTFIGEYGASAIAWATVVSSAFQFVLLLVFSFRLLGLKSAEKAWLLKDLLLFAGILAAALLYDRSVSFDSPFLTVGAAFVFIILIFFLGIKLLKINLKAILNK
ncbi:murein biosynthesis integral membrane protein MurJ [Planococcus sp. CAU13]|uniref:murein biosynthesis integral membrane protein MurJ n=1 Tax=Planococcus sp. CAU13 TaxID=1541197 RepID=UPI00052FFDB8|nr:lipid II flippase MurJ [Planococcus sp. CAU13]